MEVENTEEEVPQYIANVNTGKSKPKISRMADEVELVGNEGESESLEDNRSGDGEQGGYFDVHQERNT